MKKYIAGLVTGLLVAVGGVAVASIPDGSGVIHGCIKSNSMVRIIDSASQTCASGETSINWSQTGPQGATGATGATGPAGADGLDTGRMMTTFQERFELGGGAEPASGHFRVAGSPGSRDVSATGGWTDVTEVWLSGTDVEGYQESLFTERHGTVTFGETGWLSIAVDSGHYVFFRVTQISNVGNNTILVYVTYQNHVGQMLSASDLATIQIVPDAA